MITVTRFNNKTWNELQDFKRTNNIETIYTTPIPLREGIRRHTKFIVIEMNNEINKIMGLSYIINKSKYKEHNIYSDKNYNRYSFLGPSYIDHTELDNEEIDLINKLENVLFKGKAHYKRGSGISLIGDKTYIKHNLNKIDVFNRLNSMFLKRNKNI